MIISITDVYLHGICSSICNKQSSKAEFSKVILDQSEAILKF